MKILITLFISAISTLAMGQKADGFFNALSNNDLATISKHLSKTVELCIVDDRQMLPKKQAINAIRDFLKENKPRGIKVMHKGSSSGNNSQYRVAKLLTKNGPYRVFIYLEGRKGNVKIREIMFDEF